MPFLVHARVDTELGKTSGVCSTTYARHITAIYTLKGIGARAS